MVTKDVRSNSSSTPPIAWLFLDLALSTWNPKCRKANDAFLRNPFAKISFCTLVFCVKLDEFFCVAADKVHWYTRKDFFLNVKKWGSWSILNIWGCKILVKISFLQITWVQNDIFANGFRRRASFAFLHLGFHALRARSKNSQAILW